MNNLLCVKSLLTLIVGLTIAVLVVLYPDQYKETFQNVCIMVFTFYFSHQVDKTEQRNRRKKEADTNGNEESKTP